MTESPKIGAIVPWFGSKRRLAPLIAQELGPHRMYLEPFCGSLAILGSKPPCAMETVNDLHGDLINLARVMADSKLGPGLYRRLRRTLMSEDVFLRSAEFIRDTCVCWDRDGGDESAERAYWFFIYGWLGMNGTLGTAKAGYTYCVRYTANGGAPGTRFRAAINSIPWWRKRLDQVCILRRDAFELLERIDDAPATAIYCDPPYIVKGAEYVHDLKAEDHGRLAKLLCRFKRARVVVSYYEHLDLKELYPGFTKVPCELTKATSQSGKRETNKQTVAPEVLLINGPSYSRPEGGKLF